MGPCWTWHHAITRVRGGHTRARWHAPPTLAVLGPETTPHEMGGVAARFWAQTGPKLRPLVSSWRYLMGPDRVRHPRFAEPVDGIEPSTYGLRNRCSTTELHRQNLGTEVYLPGGGAASRRDFEV